VEKLSGQLVDTKMSLTTLEADKERSDARIQELERDLEDKNKILGLVEHGGGLKLTKESNTPRSSDVSSKSSDSSKKVQHSDNNGSNTTEKATVTVEQAQPQDSKQQLFGSLRDKGVGFIESLKQKVFSLIIGIVKQTEGLGVSFIGEGTLYMSGYYL